MCKFVTSDVHWSIFAMLHVRAYCVVLSISGAKAVGHTKIL